jgi:hypothetical protein
MALEREKTTRPYPSIDMIASYAVQGGWMLVGRQEELLPEAYVYVYMYRGVAGARGRASQL